MAYTTIILLTVLMGAYRLLASGNSNYHNSCPNIYKQTFRGYLPKGNSSAGIFTEIQDIHILKKCIMQCCLSMECNVAFMSDDTCYHVTCENNELCTPMLSQDADVGEHVTMVLVRPVSAEESWDDVLKQAAHKNVNNEKEEVFNLLDDSRPYDPDYKYQDPNILVHEYTSSGCTVGISTTCLENEECVQNFPKSRAGTCKCKAGYMRTNDGSCILNGEIKAVTESSFVNETSAITKKHLSVSVESKTVKLPESEVSLTAIVSPAASAGEKYQYDWTSLQQPKASTATKHQNSDQMELSKLSEGLYTFKVTVSNDEAYGEMFVNVTVLPPSRINTPPHIVITPANQTIKLPNTGAVLDASSTTDDNGIILYHWELQQGPLGYEPQLTDTSTLQLNDLTRPGNYTFKLTVTDTDKATNSSTANITVLKVIDYPPEANAGQDVLIYLPHNQITLNGNSSTDDHAAIITWEWTKSANDANKAVDMQDTHTPYLKLSNLEEGMYTFILKVTDSANQSSTAEVHVFVKPPTNQPPVAEAGDNITISLPQTWVMVDASKSKDDNKIEAFNWEKVEGPSLVSFVDSTSSKTNVTGLTKGRYIFNVTVRDDNNNTASDLVFVTVDQNKNQKPTANAGGSFDVTLPRNVIFINGSRSSDDWAIVKWKWVRDDTSAATGNFAEGSDTSPVLMLTNSVNGIYIFNLTVFDEQGLSDTDSVTIHVQKDPKLYYLVELTMDSNIDHISKAQYETIKGKLSLLVKDGTKLHVRSIKPTIPSNKAVVDFYVENLDGSLVNANEAVEHLREKLRIDQSILGFSVLELRTMICQNNCSGHGICDEQTRNCICDTFWMQDLFKIYFGSFEDSDCRWSVLYVALAVICCSLICIGSFCGTIYLCCSWCRKRRRSTKPTTYKLIQDVDELPAYSRKGNASDTDTDSDVVFESRNKSTRFNNESRNGHKPNRNGFVKMGRRLKT